MLRVSGLTIDKIDIPKYKDELLISSKTEKILYIDINGKNSDISVLLGDKGLYSEFKDSKFKEYLGVYQENTKASEANRTTYRVITYVEQ